MTVLIVNSAQSRITRERSLAAELSRSSWHVSMSVEDYLDCVQSPDDLPMVDGTNPYTILNWVRVEKSSFMHASMPGSPAVRAEAEPVQRSLLKRKTHSE